LQLLDIASILGILQRFSTVALDQKSSSEPTHGDCLQLPKLMDGISKLKQEGLTRVKVAFSFMKRRIRSLQQRCHWGYEYTGVNNPFRLSPDELSTDEIMVRLNQMFKNVGKIPTIVREFSAANPPKPVSTHGRSPQVLM